MKYEQYFSLIKRLEKEAEQNPKAYKFRVTALAFLGYSYFLLMAIIPVALIVLIAVSLWFYPRLLLLTLKVLGKLIWLIALAGIGLFSAFGGAIRSFFTRQNPPEGYELEREEAPQIFQMIDEISEKIAAPKPDYILVSSAFNASVQTFPRRAFFGKVTYLTVGLPLMQVISPEQFRAVLAHEMGHVSKKHGSDAAWIYQLRETWARFLENQAAAENGSASFLYTKFVDWYFPYFNAYSFVLARRQELEADRMAVEFYGSKPLAEALINIEVKARILEKDFWKDVFEQAKTEPRPPEKTFSRMAYQFRSERDDAKEIIALSKALAVRSDYHDTHPSLNERLHSIGYSAAPNNQTLPAVSTETAAQIYLGSLAEKLIETFDREWQTNVAPFWSQHHEYLGKVRERLTELETKSGGNDLNEEELYELAHLKAQNEDYNSAVPILREILERNPQSAAAKFDLGSIMLENEDEKGIEMLEEAMAADISFTMQACEQIYAFLHAKGFEEKAMSFLNKAETFYEVLTAAQKERENITDRDEFEAHDLNDEKVRAITEKIAGHEEITAAYLLRKKVRYLPEKPCYVLCIETKKKWFKSSGDVKDEHLLEVVVNQVEPFGINFALVLKKFKRVRKELHKIPNAKIYQS
ncbi:MAG: M48 family metalloprotease [Acidobacteriota bacterium]|nr:M48 family metalloprotease [Acidobacteriota bacterium]